MGATVRSFKKSSKLNYHLKAIRSPFLTLLGKYQFKVDFNVYLVAVVWRLSGEIGCATIIQWLQTARTALLSTSLSILHSLLGQSGDWYSGNASSWIFPKDSSWCQWEQGFRKPQLEQTPERTIIARICFSTNTVKCTVGNTGGKGGNTFSKSEFIFLYC